MREHKISRYRLYLNNYVSPSTYESYYSTEYFNDLNSLASNKNYNAFFAKYGTHIVGSAIYGGRLYSTYSLVSNNTILNSDVESAIKSAVSFTTLSSNTYLRVKEQLEANMKLHLGATQSDLTYGFYVNAIGGNAFSGGLRDSFSSGYDSWTNSFNTDDAKYFWIILPKEYDVICLKC